jgi:hypothetical protein
MTNQNKNLFFSKMEIESKIGKIYYDLFLSIFNLETLFNCYSIY